ncbi:MAG TPA: ABC transporter substrate-binding protein [Verrucomicrobiae bacterium]|jgi:phospholipid transport system substrate-binding protein|nr:ABC transporter substrate-binding protein [Verrucomicrobiae bacterium]
MIFVRRALAPVLILLFWAAATQASPAGEQFKADLDRVLKVLDETGGQTQEARRAAIRTAADPVFDWREMASRALAMHWQARTEEERAEFTRLFADLIERAYVTKVERYSGEAVKFVGDRAEGSLAVVQTRFVPAKGPEVPMDYRLIERDGRWRVYDVVIEGVSLVANYRTQFDRVIRSSSYAELVKRLKDKS